MKKKDFKEVSVAQAMIEAAQKKISKANTVMQQTREKQRSVLKRKFLSQPSKPKSKKSWMLMLKTWNFDLQIYWALLHLCC